MRPLRHPYRMPNEPPFFRGSVALTQIQASGHVPTKGHYRCGTVPGFHRASLVSAPLRLNGASATLVDREDARLPPGPPSPASSLNSPANESRTTRGCSRGRGKERAHATSPSRRLRTRSSTGTANASRVIGPVIGRAAFHLVGPAWIVAGVGITSALIFAAESLGSCLVRRLRERVAQAGELEVGPAQ